MQYFVFGATGYIGSYIYHQLVKDGLNVIGTSRRTDSAGNLVFYEIQKNNIEGILAKVNGCKKTAIICIAEPNIDRCYENYDDAYEINVTGTKRLIQSLDAEGFRIIYYSSDSVFDGISGNYTEESPINPINKYGMMKAEMEQYLLKNVPDTCILRIPKVVSTMKCKQNILTELERMIGLGKVRCIQGNRLSFVSAYDIYYASLLAAERELKGLYNVAGDIAYSRAELARRFYDRKGVLTVDVCECPVSEFLFKDRRPLNMKMSNQKFKDATGYTFMDIDSVIDKYLEENERIIEMVHS